ncbi:hypothetical protein PV325_007095 [Microctonus aethiopoides]|nr:hypothetical protein PV325_007095 [Microctonus aethiopoides]
MSSVNKNVDDSMIETLLEKLRSCLPKISENGETVRSALSKIYLRVISSDRRIRERTLEILWNKESSAMELFIILLEICKDNAASYSITGILHESISPRTAKVKLKGTKSKHATSKNITRTIIAQLIHFGGTQVFLKLLISSQRADSTMTEILVQEILWMLGQIAQKDQKFPTKVRLLNITKLFHSLLKQHYNDSKLLLPLLLILKSLSKNTFAVQILIKDGIVPVFEKTFVCIGYSPHLKLKILLECFKHFTTNRLGCAKFVKVGMVHMLTRIFERWDKWDSPIKQKIANYALCTLHHLCLIKSGRKSIKANNGLQLLHRFCTNCPDIKAYDCLLSRVCGIINQCLEKKELPVPEMSPARFNLPNGNGKRANSVESCSSDFESQANSINSLGRICSDIESGDDDDGEDDDEDDDDNDDDDANEQQQQKINSRMARNKLEQIDEINNIDEAQFFASVITSQRSTDDLLGYNVLFTEQNNLASQCGIEIRSKSDNTIANDAINKNNIKRLQVLKHVKSCDSNNWPEVNADKKQLLNEDYPRQLKLLDNISKLIVNDDKLIYCNCASRVRSVIPFVKVAYPDLVGGNCHGNPEPLNDKVKKVCRSKLLNNVDRGLRSNSISHETIFDLDALTTNVYSVALSSERLKNRGLNNFDDERIGNRCVDIKSLQFESRFESGNLRKAIQTGTREYDLILTPDVNSASRHQWFYFEVSNMEANIPYTFNIVNCEKANSQFNFGMKPILFSVMEAQLGRCGWIRTGVDICYYRNCYRRPCKGRNYFTTSFTVTFPHSYDICYLAYHFPYTYSQLMTHIWRWSKNSTNQGIYFKAVTLCDTLNNNECPLLTITNVNSKMNPISKRKNIFLTSRVHPGESNSSWVMHGTLEALLSDTNYAKSLRDDYVFKIIPMLNIEGVVNGW